MSIQDSILKLNELKEDTMTPKGLKEKLNEAVEILQNDEEDTIKINKVLGILDDVSSENNIQPYVRTQIWNIVSILESI
jgi:uncharacterized protein (UPF0147 family)